MLCFHFIITAVMAKEPLKRYYDCHRFCNLTIHTKINSKHLNLVNCVTKTSNHWYHCWKWMAHSCSIALFFIFQFLQTFSLAASNYMLVALAVDRFDIKINILNLWYNRYMTYSIKYLLNSINQSFDFKFFFSDTRLSDSRWSCLQGSKII